MHRNVRVPKIPSISYAITFLLLLTCAIVRRPGRVKYSMISLELLCSAFSCILMTTTQRSNLVWLNLLSLAKAKRIAHFVTIQTEQHLMKMTIFFFFLKIYFQASHTSVEATQFTRIHSQGGRRPMEIETYSISLLVASGRKKEGPEASTGV